MPAARRTVRARIFGVTFELEGEGEWKGLLDRYRQYFADGEWNELPAVRLVVGAESCRVSVGDHCESIILDPIWPSLETVIRTLVIACRREWRFVHASGVCDEEGAVLFVGPSTSGKSTLAMAIQERGYRLLADDLTPLSLAHGKVFPYQTGQSLRPFTQALATERDWAHGYPQSIEPLEKIGADVRAVFFLKSHAAVSGRPVLDASGTNIVAWRKICRLVNWPEASFGRPFDSFPSPCHPEDFAKEPDVAPCPTSEAIRYLFNHLHPPHPPLKALLPEASHFFAKVRFFNLRVGHLDQTIEEVLRILRGLSPCNVPGD